MGPFRCLRRDVGERMRGASGGMYGLCGCSVHLEGALGPWWQAGGSSAVNPEMGKTHPILETLGTLWRGMWRHSPGVLHHSQPSEPRQERMHPPGPDCSSVHAGGMIPLLPDVWIPRDTPRSSTLHSS